AIAARLADADRLAAPRVSGRAHLPLARTQPASRQGFRELPNLCSPSLPSPPSGSLSGGSPGAQIVQRAFRPVARPGAAGRTAARAGCCSPCQDEGGLPLAEP